jgi:CRP/FNR family cyclic AMP-dependent transcriptional regulator
MSLDRGALTTIPLFEGLDGQELDILIGHIDTMTYQPGDALFSEGDPSGSLMIVGSGAVEIFIYDEQHNPIVLNRITRGGFFGEVTLFDNTPRSTNARIAEPTELYVIHRDDMVDFLHKHPDAAIKIITVLSKRLRDATVRITGKQVNAYDVLHAKLGQAKPQAPLRADQ